MSTNEVFPHPTVKQVIFQIRFPNLFAMPTLVGQYQTKIMEKFPESSLAQMSTVLIAEMGPGAKLEPPPNLPEPGVVPVWQFSTPSGVKLDVLQNSLALHSTVHKTYRHPSATERFRDLIEYAVTPFLQVTRVPLLTRIGLRYVDECPVPPGGSNGYRGYYSTTFPLERFPIEQAASMQFRCSVKRGDCSVNFREALDLSGQGPTMQLDTDAYRQNVKASEYLQVTDELHDLVIREFEDFAKAPFFEYMRRHVEKP